MEAPSPNEISLELIDSATAPWQIAEAFRLLPVINLFRAMAISYIRYVNLLFQRLELDSALERMIVLLVARRSDCLYVWRQNVVVARSVGVSQDEIDALERSELSAPCFDSRQRTAFRFTDGAIDLIEVTEGTFADARAEFSARAVTEMLYVIGTYMFLCRLARTGRVPPNDKPADAPVGN